MDGKDLSVLFKATKCVALCAAFWGVPMGRNLGIDFSSSYFLRYALMKTSVSLPSVNGSSTVVLSGRKDRRVQSTRKLPSGGDSQERYLLASIK